MSMETAVTSVACSPAHKSQELPAASPRLQQLWLLTLRTLFLVMLAIYVSWNLYWLVQLRIAPSLFQTLTGLPCPTTGCTRSFFALIRGDWQESLRFNALLVPICLLTMASVLQLVGQVVKRHKLALSRALVVLWAVILPLAWVLKLASNPQYW